jgi:putative membrane protein
MTAESKNWLQLVFDLKDSVVPVIKAQVILSMIFAVGITLIYQQGFTAVHQPALAGIVPGIVLGLLLVFRTNTAYDRFWEGRKVAGGIVITSLNLARKLAINVPAFNSDETQEKVVNLRFIYVFYITVISHLRGEPINDKLKQIISAQHYAELAATSNMPLAVVQWISDYVYKLFIYQHIDSRQLEAYNTLLDQLVDSLACCERILTTPMPRAYSIHLKHLLFLYCFALPFQLVKDLQFWTIPTVGIIAFALFGIEAIGLEIENPFGYDANDIPLETLANKVENYIEGLINSHKTDAIESAKIDVE